MVYTLTQNDWFNIYQCLASFGNYTLVSKLKPFINLSLRGDTETNVNLEIEDIEIIKTSVVSRVLKLHEMSTSKNLEINYKLKESMEHLIELLEVQWLSNLDECDRFDLNFVKVRHQQYLNDAESRIIFGSMSCYLVNLLEEGSGVKEPNVQEILSTQEITTPLQLIDYYLGSDEF